MKLEVKDERKNPLLSRHELDALIIYDSATPKRDEVRKLVAEKYGVEVERVIVEKMESLFGTKTARAHIHIYDTVEDAKKYERKHILKRHGLLEQEAKQVG
ncbi:MAG: 30S ribosomal protein S24e [Thaumarchaeota archaeon]|nr:30S ribosomal protein S24e [Nitrososphaerota archaeon]